MPERAESAGDLMLLALLYAGDELDDQAKAAFEQRLDHDQAARDALAQAVETSLLLTSAAATPSPAYRDKVRRRLRPSWYHRLVGRRSYRGHPLVWSGLGAAVAAVALLLAGHPTAPQSVRETVVLQQPGPPAQEPAAPGGREVAAVWAELHNHDHLTRAVAQERRRRDRAEDRRLTRAEGRRLRRSTSPSDKQ